MSVLKPERIAKRLARVGVGSRREAERMIADGRVAVDGVILTSAAVNVGPESRITLDGTPIGEPASPGLWRYHKPRGPFSPRHGHKLAELSRPIQIGGLGPESEGLLLLTNDGDLAQTLQERAAAWRRQYRVRILGHVETNILKRLGEGIEFEQETTGPIRINLDRRARSATWLIINVENDAHQMITHHLTQFGLQATRFIRISFGPYLLGDLPRGAVEPIDMNNSRLI